MSVTVKVRGKDALAKKLKQLAPEAQKALEAASEQAAQEMVNSARSFVPVDQGVLRASIRTEAAGTDTGAIRVLAGGPTTTKPVRAGADASYDYALGQEFGTQEGNAQPFFFPAYRLAKKRHKGRATRALNKSIKKVAK